MVAFLHYLAKYWDWKVICGMTYGGEPPTLPPLICLPMLGHKWMGYVSLQITQALLGHV